MWHINYVPFMAKLDCIAIKLESLFNPWVSNCYLSLKKKKKYKNLLEAKKKFNSCNTKNTPSLSIYTRELRTIFFKYIIAFIDEVIIPF